MRTGSELPSGMDEATYREAREEMEEHNDWVTETVPILRRGINDSKEEFPDWDQIDWMTSYTWGMLREAENAGREGGWSYEAVLVRLCAATFQLAEAVGLLAEIRVQVQSNPRELFADGNRRSPHGGQP